MNTRAVLLVNLGSPDSTSVADVRAYLREFLMDGRVLDAPYPVRWCHRSSLHFAQAPRAIGRGLRKNLDARRLAPGRHQPESAGRVAGALPACRWNWPCATSNPSIPERRRPAARERHPKRCCSSRFFRTTPCPATKPPSSASRKSSRHIAPGNGADRRAALLRSSRLHPGHWWPARPNICTGLRPFALQFPRHSRAASAQGRPHRLPLSDGAADCCEQASPAQQTCYRAQCFKTAQAFVGGGDSQTPSIPSPSNPAWAASRGSSPTPTAFWKAWARPASKSCW